MPMHSKEGWVALYINSNIQHVINDIKTNVYLDILMHNKSFRIGVFYRPDQNKKLDAEIAK